MLWCPACAREAPLGKKFCRTCGAPLQEKVEPCDSEETPTIQCPACERIIPAKKRFCRYCGSVVSPGQSEPNPAGHPAITDRSSPEPPPESSWVQDSPGLSPHSAAEPRGSLSPSKLAVTGVIAAAVLATGGIMWYLSLSPREEHAGTPVPEQVTIGTATVKVDKTPLFEKAAQASTIVSYLASGETVRVVEIPRDGASDGVIWIPAEAGGARGFIENTALTNFIGESDQNHFHMLRALLHPKEAEGLVLEEDIHLLQRFLRDFPDSSLKLEAKLDLADRALAIARAAARSSDSNGYRTALEWGQQAANTYGEAFDVAEGAQRDSAQRGRDEALELVSASEKNLRPQPVVRLAVDRSSVVRGARVTLSWITENADRVTLEPGFGNVETRGNRTVTPPQSTDYRVIAHGARTQSDATVRVSVTAPSPTVTLTAQPPSIQRGEALALTWKSSDARDVSIGPGIGRVQLSGTMQAYPEHSGTYLITAQGEGGSSEAVVSFTVTEPTKTITLSIPAGTQISVRLVDTLNSGSNQTGQTFRATLDEPITLGQRPVFPKHSEVTGRIQSVTGSGRVKGVARMELVLSSIRTTDQEYTIYTDSIALSAQSARGKDARNTAIATGIGAAIGAIFGGGKGAAKGAGAGAAAGTGVALATKGQELELRPEARLDFRLAQPVAVQVRE